MPKISEERKEATRQRLIDAAVEVALAGGPEGVTTRRILDAAGLSAGALYHYFASKDEIYEAIAQRFVDLDLDLGVDDPDREVDVVDVHVSLVAACFGPGTTSVLGRLRATALDNPGVAEVLRRYDAKILEQYAEINRRTIKIGLFRSDVDPEAMVDTFAVFLDGFSLRRDGDIASGRQRVAWYFVEALAARALEPDHPRAAELRQRLEDAVRP